MVEEQPFMAAEEQKQQDPKEEKQGYKYGSQWWEREKYLWAARGPCSSA